MGLNPALAAQDRSAGVKPPSTKAALAHHSSLRGPGLVGKNKAGTWNETSVFAAFDLAPSILAIANVNASDDVDFNGENVASVLLGQSSSSRAKFIFWRRPPDRKTVSPTLSERLPDLAVREGDWKLLCEYDGTKPQLYDLTKDRGETTNLAAQYPDIVSRLSEIVLAWHQSMPSDNGPAIGSQQPKPKGKKKD